MNAVGGVHRISAGTRTDAVAGRVRLSPAKLHWVGGMYAGAIVGGALTFSWGAMFSSVHDHTRAVRAHLFS